MFKSEGKELKSICVLGLGYIGLPTASMFATHGYHVFGCDINKAIIDTLQQGKLHIEEPGLSTVVKAALSSGNLNVSTQPTLSDVYIIAVPTPYHHSTTGIPTADMSFVQSALNSILPLLKKGNLVILESTSPPGTTASLIVPAIEKKGFKIGQDIGVCYCPERVIPGRALKELIDNDRIVGGITPEWAEITKTLYKSFVSGNIFLTDPTSAEMVKILENTYRDVNIGLANEAARICEKLGINVWEVIRLANRHPRVNVHTPGPGVGGHCISVDPWFLVEQFPEEANLIRLARQTNDQVPLFVAKKAGELLQDKKVGKISVLGLAYKANVDDTRESPSWSVIDQLKKNFPNHELCVYDPHVQKNEGVKLTFDDVFRNSNLIVILSAHDEFKKLNPEQVAPLMKTRAIYDSHNIIDRELWRRAGFVVESLGFGVNSSDASKDQ